MNRFMVGDSCLFSKHPVPLRTTLKTLLVSLAAALALVALSACNDEERSASEPVDQLQVLKQAHVREIASVLNTAYELVENRNFDACIAMCSYILSREPGYSVAKELATDCEILKCAESELQDAYLLLTLQTIERRWKEELTPDKGTLIPKQDTLAYPHLGLQVTVEMPRSVGCSKMD